MATRPWFVPIPEVFPRELPRKGACGRRDLILRKDHLLEGYTGIETIRRHAGDSEQMEKLASLVQNFGAGHSVAPPEKEGDER